MHRIAHILPWPAVGGGVEQATLRLVKATAAWGFEHVAYCLPQADQLHEAFRAAGCEVATYEAALPSYRHPAKFLRAGVRLARDFARRRIDLVDCADLLAGYYAAIPGKLAGRPVVCHIRCPFESISRRDASFLRAVDRFVFVSKDTWQRFGLDVPEHRGTLLYDGIDPPDLDAAEARRSVRRQLGIPESAWVVGMVARVAPAKDYETLIRAAVRIAAECQPVRFVVVGDHSSTGEYRRHYQTVKAVAAAAGVAPLFLFTGHREDVPRMIAAFDMFVLSTHGEGLPLVVLEAMSQGRPVAATRVGGIPELIVHGETGLLHERGDDEALAGHFRAMMADRGRAFALGRAGQAFVLERFSTARFAAGAAALYRDMLRRW